MKTMQLLLLAAPIVPACNAGERAITGKCPAGEVCSSQTPEGLQFIGASFSDTMFLGGPSPTAIGGTQRVQLEYHRTLWDTDIPLDVPFDAAVDSGSGVGVETIQGSVVVLRGVASGSDYLRITDPVTGELFDRKTVGAAAIDSISLVAATGERIPPGVPIGFAAGQVEVAVALYGTVQDTGPLSERLVDEGMSLAAIGGTQHNWDSIEFDAAGPGVYPISVTAANRPTVQVDAAVYDHLDSLAAHATNPVTLVPNQPEFFCFDPMAAGHFVSGASFHFTVTGIENQPVAAVNCIALTTQRTEGQVSIVASAMGMTATATIPIGAARVSQRVRTVAVQELPSPMGDRAAL